MDYALNVPEVLNRILQLTVPSAQAAAAQTCQRWSEPSLQLLWRSLPSIYPPLKLLAPLVYRTEWESSYQRGQDGWQFETDLFEADWERFNRYTSYTRYIRFDDKDTFQGQLGLPSQHLFADAYLHRPPSDGPIFPNLNAIEWISGDARSLTHILSFLTPSITSLNISCESPDICTKLLRTLGPRRVSLSHLTLAIPDYDEAFLKHLTPILSSQTCLVSASLPSYLAAHDVVAALGQLPHLKEYTLCDNRSLRGMKFNWPPGSFASLEKLSLVAPLSDVGEVMGEEYQSRLQSLDITCETPVEHGQLQSLSTKLSTSLPHLTSLSLFLYSKDFIKDCLPFHSLLPLLQCRALSTLVIGHTTPLIYTEGDIKMMGEAWPCMDRLRLCADPVYPESELPGQPLGSISLFARYFPNLALLGIYINTFDIPFESSMPARFRVLDVLDIGTSTEMMERERLHVLLYLGGALTPTTVLNSGRTTQHLRALYTNTSVYDQRAEFWTNFASDLRIIQASNLVTAIQALTTRNHTLSKEVGRLNDRLHAASW
ncbi:hypothetical protein FRB93_002834 [Tulasnella sp. JGI-2019a]|nr:hypothetical protein FRB93_002834 [Tulasnella sp. JGI-2019a]